MNNFEEHPLLLAARLLARICCRLSLKPDPSPRAFRARRFIENKRLRPPGESELFAILISFFTFSWFGVLCPALFYNPRIRNVETNTNGSASMNNFGRQPFLATSPCACLFPCILSRLAWSNLR